MPSVSDFVSKIGNIAILPSNSAQRFSDTPPDLLPFPARGSRVLKCVSRNLTSFCVRLKLGVGFVGDNARSVVVWEQIVTIRCGRFIVCPPVRTVCAFHRISSCLNFQQNDFLFGSVSGTSAHEGYGLVSKTERESSRSEFDFLIHPSFLTGQIRAKLRLTFSACILLSSRAARRACGGHLTEIPCDGVT